MFNYMLTLFFAKTAFRIKNQGIFFRLSWIIKGDVILPVDLKRNKDIIQKESNELSTTK